MWPGIRRIEATLEAMEAGPVTSMLRSAKRRLIGISIFWALFAVALGVANGVGFIDGTVAVNFVR